MKNVGPEDTSNQGSGTTRWRITELSRNFPVIFPVAMLLFGTFVVSAIFAILVYMLKDFPVVTSLPIIAVLGIVTLLFALSGIAYVFAGVSLSDKSQAMALPPGTIQAVIALSLVVMFSILSVFVFQNSSEVGLVRLGNLNSAERDEQIKSLGPTLLGWEKDANNKFTILVQNHSSDQRNDIGKQLIVLIGTLMTSAVSFYFGSRATAAGQGTPARAEAGDDSRRDR